jgi:hypothetical protein
MNHRKTQKNTYRLDIDLGGAKTEIRVLDEKKQVSILQTCANACGRL